MKFIRAAIASSLAVVAAAAPTPLFVSYDGLVRIRYPGWATPGHDFAGRSLMSSGWRLMWDGAAPGPGTGEVVFSQAARPADGIGSITEMLRIGAGRDRRVVATCGTAGMRGPNTRRLPNRMLDGHRWTLWSNSDAGMSQQVIATDWRTVVDGTCYAIDRISYAVKAADDAERNAPTQAVAAAHIDAILASVVVGTRR